MGFFDEPVSDGRRNSNPLTEENSSPTLAPNYQLYRHVIANDPSPSGGYLTIVAAKACNFAGYLVGLIQGVARNAALVTSDPGGTSTITITVYEWHPGSGKFVATGESFVAGSAGQPIKGKIDANGKRLFLHVSGLQATESVSIYTSGAELDGTL